MDFNNSDWTECLIDSVWSFSVSVPSQNPYKLIEISSKTPNKHPPKKPKNVKFSQNRCFVQNGFLKSRPPTAALADPPEAKCSYIDPLSFILSSKTGFSRPKNDLLPQVFDLDPRFSWKSTFSFGAFFDLFLVEHGPNISLGPTGPKWMGPTGPNRRYSNTIRHYSDAIQTLFGAIQMLFRRYSTLFKHYSDTIRRYSNAIWTLFDAIQTLFRRYSDAIQTLSDANPTLLWPSSMKKND